MRNRFEWVDAARGVAILLVLLHHSIQWSGSAGFGSPVWLAFTEAVATMRLPLFFTLSGFLAVKWMSTSWRELLTSKVASLIWLYLLWQAITVASYMAVPNVSTPGKSNLRELLTAAATPLLPQNSLWFIWALALFFVVCRALYAVAPGWLVVAAAAAPSALCFAGAISLGNVGWEGAADNFIFFAFGVYGASAVRWLGCQLTWKTALIAPAAWGITLVLIPDFSGVLWNLPVRALGVAAGISFGVLLSKASVLRGFGANTLTIYLPHFVVLGILAYLASIAELPGNPMMWLPGALFITTLVVCFALHSLLERWGAGAAYRMPVAVSRKLAPESL